MSEVDVHLVDLTEWGERDREFPGFLDDEERIRAEALILPAARKAFLRRRGAYRVILAELLGCNPGDLRYEYGSTGKPRIVYPAGAPAVSFSSSDDRAALAIGSPGVVGIDLELPRHFKSPDRFFARYSTPEEQRVYQDLPPDRRLTEILVMWTKKEALTKAYGTGLAADFRTISTHPGRREETVRLPEPYSVRTFELPDTTLFSVAVEGVSRPSVRLFSSLSK